MNGTTIRQGQPILPHMDEQRRTHDVFSGEVLRLHVYGNLCFGVHGYRQRQPVCVCAATRQGDIAQYLHGVGPGRRDGLRTVALAVVRESVGEGTFERDTGARS